MVGVETYYFSEGLELIKIIIFVVLSTVCLISSECIATPIYGTVTMNFSGLGAKDAMTIWGGGLNGVDVYAGVYMFNKTAGTGQGQNLANGYIGGLCMDLSEYVDPQRLTYDVLMPQDGPRPTTFLGSSMGEVKADYLAELWSKYYDPAWAAGGNYTAQQNSNAEAFAAAVWEIVYEDLPGSPAGWDVTVDGTAGNGGFKAQNLDFATANNWLHSLDGTGVTANLRSLSYIGSQDMLVAIPNFLVPEPATVALLAFGFLAIGKRNFKRKIKSYERNRP
jgi:hypothetical protein